MEREQVQASENAEAGKPATRGPDLTLLRVSVHGTGPISREQARAAHDASGYDLSSHPAHMIRRAHQRATFYFQQVMNGLDLTPTQQAALATLLKHGELSQNHLGRLTAMDPSTISIVVQKLRRNGLIHRRGSRKDQRLAMIRLTERGVRFAIARLADSMEVARRVLAPLSRSEQKTLINLLHKIGDGDDDFA